WTFSSEKGAAPAKSVGSERTCQLYRRRRILSRTASIPTGPGTLMLTLRIARGRCLPLGATAQPDGVNFALLCRHGTAVSLVLYPLDGDAPLAEVALPPRRNRTGDHWHVLVAGLPPAFAYGWRVDGPQGDGHCFDPSAVLIDPAATALSGGGVWGRP